VDVTEMGGSVAHAVLDFGHGQLQLGEPSPDYHLVPPPEGEDDCYSLASTAATSMTSWYAPRPLAPPSANR
jgi:hypothetical protein